MSDLVKRGAKAKAAPVMMVAHTRVHVMVGGVERDVRVGDRVLSDDPIVAANAWGFIEESAGSEAAKRAAQAFAMEGDARARAGLAETERQLKAAEERFKPKEKPPIPLERQRLAIAGAGVVGVTQFFGRVIGGDRLLGLRIPEGEPMHVRAGEIADAEWLVVKKYPECFVDVLPAGVVVEDALLCIADEVIKRFDANGERVVYPGQMIHKDDELVRLNPTMFAPVGTPWNARRELITVAGPQQVVSDTGPGTAPRHSGYVGG